MVQQTATIKRKIADVCENFITFCDCKEKEVFKKGKDKQPV